MGYPASGVEKTYRNDINEVAKFLNSRHPHSYRVYNLSERRYDYSKFYQVAEFGFPDHHPPPLRLLIEIMNDMLRWTCQHPDNVVVAHCLAGKGRTGVICSCFLLLTGEHGSLHSLKSRREMYMMVSHTVDHFCQLRGQGVRFPSQALYIYYFVKMLRKLRGQVASIPALLPPKRLLLKRVILHGIPDFDAAPRGGCTPFLQVSPAPFQHRKTRLLYNSSWQRPVFETYVADDNGIIAFETNCYIEGDILIRCFHANTSTMLGKHIVQMFHFSFHTSFLRKNCAVYRLGKTDVDEAADSDRFPESFFVECCVEIESQQVDPSSEVAHALDSEDSHDDRRLQSERMSCFALLPSTVKHVNHEETVCRTQGQQMGWLYKQGGFVKNWKQRWFVAREGKLTYYSNASVPTPLGGVRVDVCRLNELNTRNWSLHYFKIVPPWKDQRTYFFGAETESEMIAWIRVLAKESCHEMLLHRAPTGGRYSDSILLEQGVSRRHFVPKAEEAYIRPNSIDSSTSTQLLTPVQQLPKESHVTRRSQSQYGDPRPWNRSKDTYVISTPQKDFEWSGMSAEDRETVLRDLEHWKMSDYVYTADELQKAKELQKYLREQPKVFSKLTNLIEMEAWDSVEKILIEIVETTFPNLLDAMEFDPLAFAEMIVERKRVSEVQF
ncbi:unnamed protein product [Albugo candida]|nr:unnamed protein product [Albugo candida]|eukprot:CCI48560.1 unnamed protein product [Albugo candida]